MATPKKLRNLKPGERLATNGAVIRPTSNMGVSVGDQYSDEELEFLKAIDRFKREYSRPFPTWLEVLDVLRGLGWRKVV